MGRTSARQQVMLRLEDENGQSSEQQLDSSYSAANTTTPTTDSLTSPLLSNLRQRPPSRILDRDAAFFQSRGRWKVQNVSRDAARHHLETEEASSSSHQNGSTINGSRQLIPSSTSTSNSHSHNHQPATQQCIRRRRVAFTKRFWNDWFYSLAYQRTVVLMFILFMTYFAIVFCFAFIYLGASKLGEQITVDPDDGTSKIIPFCDMDIHDHMEALYFSLSTMTTIGYGVSDYYFGGCWTPLLLVLCQVCCAITFDAVAIGLLFQRISRGHKRGKTIVFSNTAVIQRVRGNLYLMFRVGELRHHQLRDASVRAYCVRHERHPTTAALSNEAPTINGNGNNDEERIPIETTYYVTRPMSLMHEQVGTNLLMSLPQVVVHKVDSQSPLFPPKCWFDASGIRHERATSLSTTLTSEEDYSVEQRNTQSFLMDRQAEIILLVEGTDELTGAIIQARHSYTSDEVQWDHSFAPCVFPNEDPEAGEETRYDRQHIQQQSAQNKSSCLVDFAAFHATTPVSSSLESSPYVFD